jgi:hypothetical protein
MSNHLGDTNKMVDTPRMDASAHDDGAIWETGCDIERELNAANDRIKRLEAVTNDPHALWVNWLRGNVKLPVGIGDVRQYQDRIKRLEEAGSLALGYAAKGDLESADEVWDKAKEAKL